MVTPDLWDGSCRTPSLASFGLPPRQPEVAGLTQAGDVGLPTRGCYDALGGTTGNVVVDLSSCGIKGGDRLLKA